jgi:hypothetical protein
MEISAFRYFRPGQTLDLAQTRRMERDAKTCSEQMRRGFRPAEPRDFPRQFRSTVQSLERLKKL